MSSFSDAQLSEIASAVLEIVPVGAVMFDNFEESLRGYFDAKLRAKYAPAPFMGTCVLPTSDQMKLVDFELPFIPDCMRYLGCKAIKLNRGLMTPCGSKCKNSDFCTACLKKADKNSGVHEYGTLDERMEAYDNGEKYSAGGKTEISFGDYLHLTKKTREDCKSALRNAGFSLNVPERCFARTSAEKKRSGRPKKADASATEDEPEVEEAPKPKVKKAPLSLEEQIAQLKENAIKKAEREAAAAAKKAEKEVEKAKKDAEKAAKKAEKDAEKAKKDAEKADKPEKPKKAKNTSEKVTQLLSQLEEADADDHPPSPKTSPKTSPKKAAQDSDDEDDEDNDDSSLNDGHNTPPSPKAKPATEKVKVKGVMFIRNKDSGNVYAEDDTDMKKAIGTWSENSKTVSFNTSKWAVAIIQEQLENEIARFEDGKIPVVDSGKFAGKTCSRFLIKDNLYYFDHNTSKMYDKSGKVFWVLVDGELGEPEHDDEEYDE